MPLLRCSKTSQPPSPLNNTTCDHCRCQLEFLDRIFRKKEQVPVGSAATNVTDGVKMELHQLQSLLAVIDSGGYAPAGKALHLSHSAIHRQIRMLEQEL